MSGFYLFFGLLSIFISVLGKAQLSKVVGSILNRGRFYVLAFKSL